MFTNRPVRKMKTGLKPSVKSLQKSNLSCMAGNAAVPVGSTRGIYLGLPSTQVKAMNREGCFAILNEDGA